MHCTGFFTLHIENTKLQITHKKFVVHCILQITTCHKLLCASSLQVFKSKFSWPFLIFVNVSPPNFLPLGKIRNCLAKLKSMGKRHGHLHILYLKALMFYLFVMAASSGKLLWGSNGCQQLDDGRFFGGIGKSSCAWLRCCLIQHSYAAAADHKTLLHFTEIYAIESYWQLLTQSDSTLYYAL